MTRKFHSIALAAFIAALTFIEIPIAQAKQPCSAEMPSNPHGRWWSYRLIDGRKCWYEGKPGISKSLLEWPRETSARPASGEAVTSIVPEKPRNLLDSQAWAPNSQAWAPTDPGTFEARWHARANIGARALPEEASVTDAGPATLEVDDGPPLSKADRLPLLTDRKK
jgi:hypothetical protein